MAELENLDPVDGDGIICNGDKRSEPAMSPSHKACTVRPESLTLQSNNLNNVTISSQSQNMQTTCSDISYNGVATGASDELLMKKVQNYNTQTSISSSKKPAVSLTHLPKRPSVDIEFQNLSYTVFEYRLKGNKTILKCANGKFRSGELTAIMGPSGAGKSTLMNVLAGYKTSNVTGSVTINGKDRNLRKFRKMSCYIMQDDRLLPHLTVYEAMTVSANLKLGKEISSAVKKVVIEEIIETLGLSEAINTRTINLSGGQKKRLSIALELINNPPVMFFDEPTSGLDSSSCFQCLNLLKSLSRGGRTIICTIHQPSARLFEMFDYLYLLAEGQCIYRGCVAGLVPFLSSLSLHCPSYHNPADYVMEVACGEHGDYVGKLVVAVNTGKCVDYQSQQSMISASQTATSDIAKELQSQKKDALPNGLVKSGDGSTVINIPVTCTTSLLDSAESLERKIEFPTNGYTQFWILLKRTFLSQMRDKNLMMTRLISHLLVGFVIGVLYYKIGNDAAKVFSNAGCLFFSMLFLMFSAMMPTLLTFPLEMGVFVREHLNYWYSLKAFYFARTLAEVPLQIAYTVAYVAIVYFMSAQPLEIGRFLMYLNICVLISLVSQSLGLLTGAAMNVENGVFFGPILTVPLVLFSGFFIKLNDISIYLKFISYVSYIRYGFEGAMLAIYGYDRQKLKCSEPYCHYRNPDYFLESMSMNDAVYWIDVVALLGIFVLIRIVTYLFLRLKLRSLR